MADDTLKQLQDRIDALERLVATMRGRGGDDPLNPFRFVFLARTATSDDTGGDDPASGTWVEQAVNGGEVSDFPDGRKSLADGDASNLINDLGDAFYILETLDYDEAGNAVHRYTPIRGGTSLQTLRITGTSSPVALGGGAYWAVKQKRKTAVSLDPTPTTFTPTTFWEDDGDPVIVFNFAEQNVASAHGLSTNQFIRGVPAGEQTVTLSNGSKYDVYDFFGYSLGCA
jgi:hypothetical protein